MELGNITGDNLTTGIVLKRDTGSYKVNVDVEDYKKTDTSATLNIIKKIKATVFYKANNQEKSIELSTILK